MLLATQHDEIMFIAMITIISTNTALIINQACQLLALPWKKFVVLLITRSFSAASRTYAQNDKEAALTL
ncbi:hypothetical protein BK797_17995 [Kosakonia sacchari]|nr:hypothetical protein BK797_17995 [Kosakonia sacchari]